MDQYKLNPTGRFSDRVDSYVKYRPGYPEELFTFMKEAFKLTPRNIIVDIGSGTGIFSEFLLTHGCQHVTGVEPNREMRQTAEKNLAHFPDFQSVDGQSENTGLKDQSADLITAAQAFHWFERGKTRTEFKRILKPGGYVVLIWNDRQTTETPFAREYEDLISGFGTDYSQVNHKNINEGEIRQFLGEDGYGKRFFYNFQELDFEGLVGRLTSSSYAPNVGHPRYNEMVGVLKKLFNKYQVSQKIKIEYDTKIFFSGLCG